jgi:hypothetical protein
MHNYYRVADPTVRKRLFQLVRTLAFSEAPEAAAEGDTSGGPQLLEPSEQ